MEIYYPVWLAFATVVGQIYEFEISAVTGKILGEENVPEREKGYAELTKEALEELKEPRAWLRYGMEIAAIGIATIGREKLAGKKGKDEKKPVEGEIQVEKNGNTEIRLTVKKGSHWKMPVGKKAIARLFRKPAFWITIALLAVLIAAVLWL